jgi:hypothetical protein
LVSAAAPVLVNRQGSNLPYYGKPVRLSGPAPLLYPIPTPWQSPPPSANRLLLTATVPLPCPPFHRPPCSLFPVPCRILVVRTSKRSTTWRHLYQ